MSVFHEAGYLAHNKARLDHLASLNLPIEGKTVLELGAGAGDHTQFFLERDCKVTVTDGREENVRFIRRWHPDWNVRLLDVEMPFSEWHDDIVYCYGLLYHCQNPILVLENIFKNVSPQLFLLETCVSPLNPFLKAEDRNDPRCSIHGVGSRINRSYLRKQLQRLYPYVYMPLTQPNHDEFPLDWNNLGSGECRAVYIASMTELKNPLLTTKLPMTQTKYVNPV